MDRQARPRVLLLMATRTYRAEAFMRAASAAGVEVTVATEREHVLAGFAPDAMLTLDFRDPRHAARQAADFAARYPLRAVVGVDDDTTVLAAQVAEALGLPHNAVDAARAARYKDLMRLALSEADLLSPPFELVGVDEDPLAAARRLPFPFPCVVKPLSLAASRGVIRADDPESFAAALRTVGGILREADLDPADPAARQVLVEAFIPGREFALEGLLEGGTLRPLALFDKPDPLDGPFFEETIYLTPSRLPAADQAAVVEAAGRAAAAIGLRDGPVHAEVRLNPEGAWVVEVAARTLGGLCARTLRFGTEGVSLEEIVLRQAAGLPLGPLHRERRPAGVMMIPIPAEGRLHAVDGLERARAVPGVEELVISIPCGEPVVPLPRGDRYLGFIFARAATTDVVEAALRQAHRLLAFDIR